MKVVKSHLGADLLYLTAGALFLLFLVASTPHRVHHFFDPNPETSCATFTLSKGCHLKPTPAVNLPITKTATEGIILSLEVWIPYLTYSPFSKRAPPVV
jgi:hypothetical protein